MWFADHIDSSILLITKTQVNQIPCVYTTLGRHFLRNWNKQMLFTTTFSFFNKLITNCNKVQDFQNIVDFTERISLSSCNTRTTFLVD